jgi:23S rRNA pseudouridine2605 synthase
MSGAVRVTKFLASANVMSRRDAEQMIRDGLVRVNGTVIRVVSDARVKRNDVIRLADGRKFVVSEDLFERPRLWRHYKRRGVLVSEADPSGRACLLPEMARELNRNRVMSVGRLDYNSEGLLLLTNFAPLKRFLELPANSMLRRYKARLFPASSVTPAVVDRLRDGILDFGSIQVRPTDDAPDGTSASKAALKWLNTANNRESDNIPRAGWFEVSLREGKNREIRRAFDYFHIETSRLLRVRYGKFSLGSLDVGDTVEVSHALVDSLCEGLGPTSGTPRDVDDDDDDGTDDASNVDNVDGDGNAKSG